MRWAASIYRLIFVRANSAQIAMTTDRIVELFDVVGHVRYRGASIAKDSLLDAFLFQAAEERFCDGIVPAVTAPAHARFEVI